jgi:hypothetical protein
MRTIETNCLTGSVRKRNLTLYSLMTLLILFFSTNVMSQSTISFPTSCTSKDLTLLKASLPAPAGNRCACSGDRSLILGIHNGTGSTRTSFALWGTLVRKNASGTVLSSDQIFACAGPIPPTGDYFLNATTIRINGGLVATGPGGYPVIHIECGQSLDILDMHLAWTAATPSSTCDLLYNNPSTINPKCGTQDIIHVDLGVDGSFDNTPATCSTQGKIKVTPFGGIPPYEVSLDGSAFQGVPTNTGFYQFSGVSAGTHSVVIRDNTSKPEAERCSNTKTPSVDAPAAVTADAGTDFTKTCSTNPNGKQIGETSVSGFTYSWAPTTGLSNASISNPTANPTSTTTYTVTKTNGTTGCFSTDEVIVTVDLTAPTPGISVNRSTVTCTNPSATLTASGGASYLWSTGETTTSITVSPTSNTTYSVTATGANGCTASTNQLITVDKAAPTPGISVNRSTVTCTNPSATLTASGGASYLWSTGETTTSITVSPTSNTTYSVTATGANGCTASTNQLITVDKAAPTPGISVNRSTVTCTNPSATLTASGGVSYLWSTGATTTSITVSPTSNTTYSVTATGANGCTASTNQLITVDKAAPTPGISVNRSTVTCTNPSATLTASGGASYLWSTGETTTSITVSPTSNTTYSVTATGANGCTASTNQLITVDKATPTFKVCITQPTLCNRGSLTIIPDVTGNYRYSIDGSTFFTANTTNFIITNGANATFSNLLTGDVTGVQIQNNTSGCPSATVSCSSLSSNLASSCTSAGVTNKVQEESLVLTAEPTVKAYPNPFNDRVKFVINSPAAGNGSLEVYNVMGQRVKTVYQGRINAGNQSYELVIPKKQQETLIYILRVDGKKVTGKLLQLNN